MARAKPLPRPVHAALRDMRRAVINFMDSKGNPERRAQWLADFYKARATAYRESGLTLP